MLLRLCIYKYKIIEVYKKYLYNLNFSIYSWIVGLLYFFTEAIAKEIPTINDTIFGRKAGPWLAQASFRIKK